MKQQPGLKIGDIILMVMIFITAILLFLLPFLSDKSETASIFIGETEETRIITLDKNSSYEIKSRGITMTILVENGEVSVCESDCRDGICKKTPSVSCAGQTIICAPAGVVIRVLGEEVAVDGISG